MPPFLFATIASCESPLPRLPLSMYHLSRSSLLTRAFLAIRNMSHVMSHGMSHGMSHDISHDLTLTHHLSKSGRWIITSLMLLLFDRKIALSMAASVARLPARDGRVVEPLM